MKGRRGAVARRMYEGLPKHSYRTKHGHRVVAYFDDHNGTVFVQTFGLNTTTEIVTTEQWENAVINNGLYVPGEDQ